jgi:gliding motility-associated lipoprotein GldB
MIRKIHSLRRCILCTLFISTLILSSCQRESNTPDVSAVPVNLSVLRFEQDLFNSDPDSMAQLVARLKNKYGNFFDLFAFQVTSLGHRDSVLMNQHFQSFVTDTNFRTIYTDCQQRFGDFAKYQEELSTAFRYYRYYLPKQSVPRIITLISAFSYPVICDSTSLGISLDMYMGQDYKYYSTLEPALPNYLRSRMRPEYLVSDAMKGWAMSDFESDEPGGRLLDKMVSQGRILYFLDHVLPQTPDTIKTGYSRDQLRWCEANEKQIWAFLVDNKLLFSIDPNILSKYVNEGPTTNGFPKESPGNIGQFIGWRIVKSYMKNNPAVKISELMDDKDLQRIFNSSRYKPAK